MWPAAKSSRTSPLQPDEPEDMEAAISRLLLQERSGAGRTKSLGRPQDLEDMETYMARFQQGSPGRQPPSAAPTRAPGKYGGERPPVSDKIIPGPVTSTRGRDGSVTVTRAPGRDGDGRPQGDFGGELQLMPQLQSTDDGRPAEISAATQQLLLELSRRLGVTLQIESGIRTPEQNLRVGGADRSAHMDLDGNAADVNVVGMTDEDLAQAIRATDIFNRVNIYPSGGVHIDNRERRGSGFYRGWTLQP